MSETKAPKPFYKDLPDTLDELGITRRQLSHWRDKGLFEPQLGPGKFTARDIAQLRVLKRLIVELKLETDIVQRLIVGAGRSWTRETSYLSCIDLDEVRLMGPSAVFDWAMQILLERVSDTGLESWFRKFALVRLMVLRSGNTSPLVYQARKKELLDEIAHLDLMARAERWGEFGDDDEAFFYMSPKLDGDPDDDARIREFVEEREQVLGDIVRLV